MSQPGPVTPESVQPVTPAAESTGPRPGIALCLSGGGHPPRLKPLDATLQDRIINWGYAVCDAALRKHVDNTLPLPRNFPYPAEVV